MGHEQIWNNHIFKSHPSLSESNERSILLFNMFFVIEQKACERTSFWWMANRSTSLRMTVVIGKCGLSPSLGLAVRLPVFLSNQFCHTELIWERRADINHIRGMWPWRNILRPHPPFPSQTQYCQGWIDDYSENQTRKLKSDDYPQSACCCLYRLCFLKACEMRWLILSFFLFKCQVCQGSECQVVERYVSTSAHTHDLGHMRFLHHNNKAVHTPSICQARTVGLLSGAARHL